MVYYPPNQKMYLMQSDGQAFEVILNRNDFSKSTIVKMNVTGTLRPFTNPGGTSSGDGETGWAYDSVNKIIGGGIYNNTFYAFDPVSSTMKAVTMTSSSGNPIGNLMKMHTIDFDSVD